MCVIFFSTWSTVLISVYGHFEVALTTQEVFSHQISLMWAISIRVFSLSFLVLVFRYIFCSLPLFHTEREAVLISLSTLQGYSPSFSLFSTALLSSCLQILPISSNSNRLLSWCIWLRIPEKNVFLMSNQCPCSNQCNNLLLFVFYPRNIRKTATLKDTFVPAPQSVKWSRETSPIEIIACFVYA